MILTVPPKQGFFLLELLLMMALTTVILAGISVFMVLDRESLTKSRWRQTAAQLADQQMERVKAVAAGQWSGLADGDYHVELSQGAWSLAAGDQDDGNFTKRITVGPVYRTADGAITDNAGLLDPSSKKIISTILWNDPSARSLSSVMLITNYAHHNIWTEDTYDDFADGQENATDFTTSPGFVQIAQTGGGGWTQPRSLGTVDGQRKASGICTNRQYLYLTQDSLLGGIEVFDIQTTPEQPVTQGTFAVTYRPNDCTTSGSYLYLSDDFLLLPSVSIYHIGANPTHPPYAGNLFTLLPTKALTANEHYLFASIKNSTLIRVYQLDNGHETDPQLLGYFATTKNIVSLALSGNYLYVAQADTAQAVRIYDISTHPTFPAHVGTVTMLYTPTGISVDTNILYVSMSNKTGAMLSLDNPVVPQLFGYFPTVRNSVDVTAYGDYGYVAGGDSQLKVIEIFDLSDSKGVSGIYFIYGDYLSSSLDLTGQSSFYRLNWQGETPAGTEIRMQTALNNDNVTWNYVGPDGTGETYFEQPGVLYFPASLGRYFRYKLILTGDGNATPRVDKVQVTYAE